VTRAPPLDVKLVGHKAFRKYDSKELGQAIGFNRYRLFIA
jgi:hypothetical protein